MAKDIDEEVETLAELKEKYRKELAEAKEEAYNDAVESAAIDLAVEMQKSLIFQKKMIHEEVHRAVNEFLGNMQRQGSLQTCTSKSLVHSRRPSQTI